MNYIAIFLGIMLLFCSCETKKTKVNVVRHQEFNEKKIIKNVGTINFELDSITAPKINALQEYNNGINNYLIYLNEETGNLYINDVNSKKIVKTIKIQDELPSHNKMFQGFYYHNSDSIFVFSFKPKIILINDQGHVIREYVLRGSNSSTQEEEENIFRGFWSTTLNQSYVFNDTLYLSSVRVGGNKIKRKKIQILLDLKNGNSSVGNVAFPSNYGLHDYGELHYDTYSVVANPNKNLLVYSFPGYEKLITQELTTGKIYEKEAQNESISYFVEFNEDHYKEAKGKERLEYFMTTACYGAIYYDKYRDVYYRIALLPVDKENANYDEKNAPIKQLSIAAYDSNFEYLGATTLERNKYLMFSAFISNKGLNIQNKTEKDETLDFTTFVIEDKSVNKI